MQNYSDVVICQVLHRDLALRNVLYAIELPADGTAPLVRVKLADFGHARELVGHFLLDEHAGGWEHQAIEQLASDRDIPATSATDVWALGVCIWELFRELDEPYMGDIYTHMKNQLKVTTGAERNLVLPFLRLSETGTHRLPQPANCPDSVYALLLSCWVATSNKRPSAKELYTKLQDIQNKL